MKQQGSKTHIFQCGNEQLHESASKSLASEGLKNFKPVEIDPVFLRVKEAGTGRKALKKAMCLAGISLRNGVVNGKRKIRKVREKMCIRDRV